MANESGSVYCFGCGITSRPADRRALDTPGSEHVVEVWKAFAEDEEEFEELLSESSAKMCRKCFSAYDRYSKLHDTIKENFKRAAEVLRRAPSSSGAQPLPKRPRLGSTRLHMTPRELPSAGEKSRTGSDGTTQSPEVAIQVGYKRPRTFVLTPSRKHIGKAVARQSKKTIAVESLKDPVVKKHILKKIGKEMAKEIRSVASDKAESVLRSQDADSLKTFHWDTLLQELSTFAPVLRMLLTAATKTRAPRSNTNGMCAAILLNHQDPRMNLVQKINSLILYGGHCSKQVYQRLQRLNLTVSHSSLICLLEKVGKGYDDKVKKWRDDIISCLDSGDEIQTHRAPWITSLDRSVLSSESDDSTNDSDSDSSWKSFSPITSDDDNDDSDDGGLSGDSDDEESVSGSDDENVPEPSNTSPQQTEPSTAPDAHSRLNKRGSTCMFHVIGDNVDEGVKQQYTRTDVSKPDSVHYFHSFAVADRVDFSSLSEQVIPTEQADAKQVALSLLPSYEDDSVMRDNICVLISRVLFKSLPFFSLSFDGVVEWHIKHDFYDEMSTKSDVVPLGILPKNENKGEDMVAIMTHHHQYAPMVEEVQECYIPSIDETVQVTTARARPILFGGDQLTVARARGAQKAKANATSPSERLDGLVPMVEDWHAKVVLLGIIWKHFYSQRSVGDHGTLYQLRNKLNRTSVVKTPKDNVNACEDFVETVTSGLIISSALETLKLNSVNDTPSDDILPNAHSLWTKPETERCQCLKTLCNRVYDKFISFTYNSLNKSSKVTYEDDGVCAYAVELLRLGCFYFEFADAIREGDGGRVLRCWKYMLPMFLASGNKNYACEAANFLVQQSYTLSPRLSAQLLWSRFINVHGRPGKNIAGDLHMEHLNRIAKEAIRFQGANKTEKAIERIGRAIGTLSPILENFDANNDVSTTSSQQRKPDAQKDIQIVVSELVNCNVFKVVPGRKYKPFPHPKDVLHAKDKKEILAWLVNKLPSSF